MLPFPPPTLESVPLASGSSSTVGGGFGNIASIAFSTVGGGFVNTASGDKSTVGGGRENTAGPGSWSTVGGGKSNQAVAQESTVGGGFGNIATGVGSTVGGGQFNTANGTDSNVGGGNGNMANGTHSTIGGGESNTASGSEATVGGGGGFGVGNHEASGTFSTVGGGVDNTAIGSQSTVPGGSFNEASGDFSFAAGNRAKATLSGTFVWADSTAADFTSTESDQFSVRADGGTRIFSMSDLSTGVVLANGAAAWAGISDYRLKDNISEYSVLDKLDDYRAVEFDWKAGGNHDVGVMAQELQSIFPELVNAGSSEGEITNAADPGVWSVQYSKLGALALQAIKEQQTIIDSLISIICEDSPDREICLEN